MIIQKSLKKLFGEYGIDFSVVRNFRGAPVQGFISSINFIVYDGNADIEVGADDFASTRLVDLSAYEEFVRCADFRI